MIDLEGLQSNNLNAFLEFFYGGLSGYVAVAELHRTPNKEYMQHSFYHWPEQQFDIGRHIATRHSIVDVYVCPAIFTHPVAQKEYFKASNVAWIDFDGNPNFTGHKPSLRIQTSIPGREHWYYRMVTSIESVDELERVNKCLAYILGGDHSWAANKLLRPIGSQNHKYPQKPVVSVLNAFNIEYPKDYLDEGWEDPASSAFVQMPPLIIPDLGEVILKYAFPEKASELLRQKECPPYTRSESLMALGYYCAEMGMQESEILAVLLHADDKWGKFKHRKDRIQRLSEIIVLAKQKHPSAVTSVLDELIIAGWNDILNYDVNFDWIIKDVLLEQTTLVMAGRPRVGKTQLSMRFGINMALGNSEFLGYILESQKKIAFFSLELGIAPAKKFITTMNAKMTEEQKEVLQKNFITIPIGHGVSLTSAMGQDLVKRVLDETQPNGFIIDSLGKIIPKGLRDTESVLNSMDYLGQLNKQGIFVWAIHHLRKAQQGQTKRDPELDDLFGDQYIGAMARSIFGLQNNGNGVELLQLKNSFAKEQGGSLILERSSDLDFKVVSKVSQEEKEEEQNSGKNVMFGE